MKYDSLFYLKNLFVLWMLYHIVIHVLNKYYIMNHITFHCIATELELSKTVCGWVCHVYYFHKVEIKLSLALD